MAFEPAVQEAVASVMRRGRPWQVSVLKLLARGLLPADQACDVARSMSSL